VAKDNKRGPRGGRKHTPGRGHTRKSGPLKKKRFREKAAKKREKQQEDLHRQWDEWDSLPDDVKKLRQDKKPKSPRPNDED
jgi:hypothetical protein